MHSFFHDVAEILMLHVHMRKIPQGRGYQFLFCLFTGFLIAPLAMLLKKVAKTVFSKRYRSFSALNLRNSEFLDYESAMPYELMPGPRPWPLLGNNWRFIPYIGMSP